MAKQFSIILVLVLALFASGSAVADPSPGTVQTTLYFGLDLGDGGKVSERDWSNFLRDVVTPRFPDGLTVVDAYGQWRDPAQADASILREETKIVIIVHDGTPEAATAISEIKSGYMNRFAQKEIFHTEAAVRIVE